MTIVELREKRAKLSINRTASRQSSLTSFLQIFSYSAFQIS